MYLNFKTDRTFIAENETQNKMRLLLCTHTNIKAFEYY